MPREPLVPGQLDPHHPRPQHLPYTQPHGAAAPPSSWLRRCLINACPSCRHPPLGLRKPRIRSALDVLGPPRNGLCDGEAEPSATSLGLLGGNRSQLGAGTGCERALCSCHLPRQGLRSLQQGRGWEGCARLCLSTTSPAGPGTTLERPARMEASKRGQAQAEGSRPWPEPWKRTRKCS